jgi:hypothetical protein
MIFVCQGFFKVLFRVSLCSVGKSLCTTLCITNSTWAGLGLNPGLRESSGADMCSIDTLLQCKNCSLFHYSCYIECPRAVLRQRENIAAIITLESVIINTKRRAHCQPTGVCTNGAVWKGFAICYTQQYQHSS